MTDTLQEKTFTTRKSVIILVVLVIGYSATLISAVLSRGIDSNWRIILGVLLCVVIDIFMLIGIFTIRGKSIVINADGIRYYSTAHIIDCGNKTKVDSINLQWKDIDYMSVKKSFRNYFFAVCHLNDGKEVYLYPASIDTRALEDLFNSYHASQQKN